MKILVADDRDVYRAGTRAMLEAAYPGVEIVEVADYIATLDALEVYLDLDLILYDIRIRGGRHLIGLSPLVAKASGVPVVVVSTLDFDESVEDIVRSGASGFIAKTVVKQEMLASIQQVLSGDIPALSQRTCSQMPLSRRQADTLRLILQGKSNRDIADLLGIADVTVREHVSHLMKTLEADNRTHAALLAVKKGFHVDSIPA